MAFANVTTLYIPTVTNAGSSLWGSDVRKLLDVADAASGALTVTDHGTGGAVTRTFDPYTTKATDDTEANFGWAVQPSDMNSVSGARRFFPAGNHVFTGRFGHDGAAGATGTLSMFVYRVGPTPSFTRTLLGSSTASVVLPALAAEVTATATVALPEVIFEVGESVQYSFEFNVTGIVVAGRLVTFFGGTQSAVVSRVDVPKLGVLADTTGSASGVGAGSGVSGKVLGTVGSATGLGVASGVMSSTAETTGTASGSGSASGSGGSVAGTVGSAAGSASVTGLASIVLGTVGTVEIGSGGEGPVSPEDIAAIANAVWDELTAEARTAGSYGELVNSFGTPAQAAALASLITTVGTPAQAAVLLANYSALLAAIEADPVNAIVEVS